MPPTLDLALHLLDRQVVDPDGRPVCKVDDLEMQLDDAGRPYITAILCGPLALAPRLGGRLGGWLHAVASRISPPAHPSPNRIRFELVTDIGSAIVVCKTREELGIAPAEDWVKSHIVGRIPGNRHAG